MKTTSAFLGLECTACGERVGSNEPGRCPGCEGPLDPVYEETEVGSDAGESQDRSRSMWESGAPLPFVDPVTADEGGTPSVEAPSLADELGVGRVVLKDEGRNPTGTVLDRGLSVAVTAARDHGVEPLALASPGNGGQSAAAYASRAGLRSYAFVPSRTPFANKAMVNVHGGEMRVVPGRFPDALEALQTDLQTEWHSLQEFTTPYRHEGIKTVAYELFRDLGGVPDAVVVPAGSGEIPVGVAKGFRELRDRGHAPSVPPIYLAQPSGCAPIARAWEDGLASPEPWATPDTICGELEIPDPAGGELALRALESTGGAAVAVDDADLLESAVTATRQTGVEVGVAGGTAVAGAWELADRFGESDLVAVVNTESGGKAADVLRSHLMGQGV